MVSHGTRTAVCGPGTRRGDGGCNGIASRVSFHCGHMTAVHLKVGAWHIGPRQAELPLLNNQHEYPDGVY